MSMRAYRPKLLSVHHDGGEAVTACTFVVGRRYPQYRGDLSLEQAAAIIRCCVGQSGANLEYLRNTAAHLDELGIADGPAHRLLQLAEAGS